MSSSKSPTADEQQLTANIFEWAIGLVIPGIAMGVSVLFFIVTTLFNPGLVFSFDLAALRDKHFANFWRILSKVFAKDFPTSHLDPILSSVRGTVLDVGPGTGSHVHRFVSNPGNDSASIQTRSAASDDSKVASRVIWAVEPGKDMLSALQTSAIDAGFGRGLIMDQERSPQGQYRILNCGAQMSQLIPALCDAGVCEWIGKDKKSASAEEVFDDIVTVRVLCGIPEQEDTIRGLYRLLKPGGRWILLEHVVNSGDSSKGGSPVSRLMQGVWMKLGWSFWGGGCCLDRDTLGVLQKTAKDIDGGWAKVEVLPRKPWGVVPEVFGVLTKKT